MRKRFYLAFCLLVFGAGAYVWRVKNTGLAKLENGGPPAAHRPSSLIAQVGDERINQEDVDWEYELVTGSLDDADALTPVPDLGSRYKAEIAPLRKELVGALIERKLLFRYVQQDRDFRYDDPSRYTACLTEWHATLTEAAPILTQNGGKERLKARLCERSILDQYLKERLFPKVKIGEDEVVEYYKNHMAEFKVPETVQIRHVLLGSEHEAKRVRHQISAATFAAVAKSASLAPEAAQGGRLPPFAMGELPTVFDAAFRMKKGEISDVLKSNYGYHLIMLLNKVPKKELGLEEARPRIVKTLRRRKEEEAYKQWVDQALAAVAVQAAQSTTW